MYSRFRPVAGLFLALLFVSSSSAGPQIETPQFKFFNSRNYQCNRHD